MKGVLLDVLHGIQAHRLVRFLNRKRVIVLAYHGLTDQPPGTGLQNAQAKHVHIDAFRAAMTYVKRHYRVISLEALVAAYQSSSPLPDRTLVVTMDDGFESNYRLAFPVLRALQLPATIFVATRFVEERRLLWSDQLEYALDVTSASTLTLTIDGQPLSYDVSTRAGRIACDSDLRTRFKRVRQEDRDALVDECVRRLGVVLPPVEDLPAIYRPLTWDQIQTMRESGLIDIGSHTVSHYILTRCDPDRAKEELRRSRQVIEDRTGAPCRVFCYPNGQRDCFDERTKQWLQEAGYACGITTVYGMNEQKADVFELKRLYTHGRAAHARVELELAGVIDVVNRSTRALAATRSGGTN